MIPLRQYAALLMHYLRPQWPRVAVLALLLFGDIGLQLINPMILAAFIDGITARAGLSNGAPMETTTLMRQATLFLVIALVQQGAALLATYVSENVGWTATNGLRVDLLAHTIDLDLSFHKTHTPGEMIERIDGDVTALSDFFSQFVIQVLGNALMMVGVVVVLLRTDWRMGGVVALFTVTTLAVLMGLRNLAVPHWTAEREANATFFGFLEERLAGTEDIRGNGAQAYVMRRFYALMRDQLRASLRAGWMHNIVLNVTFILFALGTAGGFAVSARLYLQEVVTLGTVYLVYSYTRMLEGPLRAITYQIQQLQRAGAGVKRVRELLDTHKRLPEVSPAAAQHVPSGALSVRFDNVTFSYTDPLPTPVTDDEREGSTDPLTAPSRDVAAGTLEEVQETVLHNIDLHLEPGTILGLLGRTGSGKTTLIRLLLRFYDPDSGSITLGSDSSRSGRASVDLRTVPLRELRQRVGVVTQEIQLFNATVRDNLALFDPNVTDDAIRGALEMLELGPWLAELPHGLDSVLNSDAGLSAGEAQLLAFARVFLQDPGLVLLDEASSRLDPATERRIDRAIDRLLAGRTAIIIAHRLNTLQRADEITILERGRIVEHGPRVALAEDPATFFHRLLQTGLEEVMA